MHATFTDDQLLFRDTARYILDNECTPAAVRAAVDGRIDGLWATLAGTGVVGLTAPEANGGLGMGAVDLVLLLAELGRAACPEPVAEHTAVAVPVLAAHGSTALNDEWLARAAEGSAVLTAGAPTDRFVVAAEHADLAVLCVDGAVHAVPAADLTVEPVAGIDPNRSLAAVGWTPSPDTLVTADPSAVDEVLDRGALAAAAQAAGVGRRLLDLTVDYVAERVQFGRPVGVNQAVKHHCSNVAIALEFAEPLVHTAAWALDHGESPDEVTVSAQVSMAKAAASDAVDLACRSALQCHGAIGYTVEHDLQLWLKRGWALSATWGDAGLHRRRLAAALAARV